MEIKDQVRDDPEFREHIGEVSEFEMDFAASFASQNSSDDTYRYKVRGSKGAGELTVKQHILTTTATKSSMRRRCAWRMAQRCR